MDVLGPVMQLDRPGTAQDGIGLLHAPADFFDGQTVAADDPAGLADAEEAVLPHSGATENLRILTAQEGDHPVGLGTALGLCRSIAERIKRGFRSEEHTSELQSLMRISYAVFCLKKKKHAINHNRTHNQLLLTIQY